MEFDTIVAVATPPGQGGVGILRLSGPEARALGEGLTGAKLFARRAQFSEVRVGEEIVDQGLALYFPGPHSFTGEDVVELQLHGSPMVLHYVLDACCRRGARLARPGEFSERAYLNDKMDLAQAEAVLDLITSGSQAAARAAARSLQGAFSARVHELASGVERLRMLIEASIDFPEEEEDFLGEYGVAEDLARLCGDLEDLIDASAQGRVLNDGISVALLGSPNAGKSSLLNRLSGEETAIVTDVPGTTRDLLKIDLVLKGVPVRLVDTAGLRVTQDPVEREGVRRAQAEAERADLVLLLVDATAEDADDQFSALKSQLGSGVNESIILNLLNKSDLVSLRQHNAHYLSAKTGEGVEELVELIHKRVGITQEATEFTARKRHVEALILAQEHLRASRAGLASQGLELLAEDLRLGHEALGEIVGRVTADDLLGRIFSEFCIGK